MTSEVIAAMFLIPLNLVGLAVMGFGLRDVYRGWKTTSFERAPGKLIDAEVKTTVRRNSKSSRTVHQVELTYAYHAGGRPCEGTVVASSYSPTPNRHDHERLLQWLQSTPQFNVFYDPLNPEKCVLVPGVDRGMFSLIALSGLLLSITLGITAIFYLISAGDPVLVQNLVTR